MRVDTHTDAMPLGGYTAKTPMTNKEINARLNGLTISNDIEPIIEVSNELTQDVVYTITETPVEPSKELSKDVSVFPTHVLPKIPKEYFESINKAQGLNIDFMATTFLTEASGLFGNSKRLEIEYGRSVQMNMYSGNVGKSGDGKTPASSIASKPFKDRDNAVVREYRDALAQYNPKGEGPMPTNKAYQVNDLTPEVRFIRMQNVERGVHQSVDELATIFEQGKKEDSSSVLLTAWSNGDVRQERASESIKDRFVFNAGYSISGGIQPQVLYNNYDNGKANGLMARFLFAFPTPKVVPRIVSRKARNEALVGSELYDGYIGGLFNDSDVKGFKWSYDSEGKIEKRPTHVYTEEAEEYFMTLTNRFKLEANHADTITSMVAVYTKMEDYRAKFSLLLHILHGEQGAEVGIKYVKMAQDLCDYYLHCHNKLFTDKSSKGNIDAIYKDRSLSRTEKVLLAHQQGYSASDMADALGVSVGTVKGERRTLRSQGKIK